MQIAFVLDIIIAVLLVLTITYAVRLNQRLSQLRGDKKELQKLAKIFAEATTKAEASIHKLTISTETLQAEVQKAETLKDDLAYLVDRGDRTADQMADSVRTPTSGRSRDMDNRNMGNEDEGRLIQEAIRAVSPSASSSGQQPRRVQPRPDTRKSGPDDGRERGGMRSAFGEDAPLRKPLPLGGGLGGLKPEDRLLDGPGGEAESIGETDAARELLKALSSVK